MEPTSKASTVNDIDGHCIIKQVPSQSQSDDKDHFLERNDQCDAHKQSHTKDIPYKGNAPDLSDGIDSDKDISHGNDHTKESQSFECKYCSKAFSDICERDTHEQSHAGHRKYQCRYCNKCFSQNCHRVEHEYTHTGKPYQCRYCSKGFRRENEMTKHESGVHSKETPYQNQSNDETLGTGKPELENEVINHKSEKDKPYQIELNQTSSTENDTLECKYCSKDFSDISEKNAHEQSHTGQRKYQCRYCDKRFAQRGHKSEHEYIHTKKPYQCAYCSKGFVRENEMIKHENAHHSKGTLINQKQLNEKTVAEDPGLNNETISRPESVSSEKPHQKQSRKQSNETFGSEEKIESDIHERDMHRKGHTGTKKYQCRYCGWAFAQKCHKVEHEYTHTGQPYQCTHCSKGFRRETQLIKHEQVHRAIRAKEKSCSNQANVQNSDSTYTCAGTEEVKIDATSYKSTLGSASKDLSTPSRQTTKHDETGHVKLNCCKFCRKAFSDASERLAHEQSHTGPKKYQCSQCDKCFIQRGHKVEHENTHTQEKPHICRYCSKAFYREREKEKHEYTHTNQCSHCKEVFPDLGTKRAHERSQHAGVTRKPKPQHQCKHCMKQFSRLKLKIRHERRVHQTSSVKKISHHCKFCKKGFATPYLTLIHERRRHTNEKPYRCTYCEKSFAEKGTKTKHERIHTQEKKYQCRHCGMSFLHCHTKNTHERSVHTKETPFECGFCEKRFGYPSQRTRHVKLFHNPTERLHSCKHCEKKFKSAGGLVVHERTHTKPWQCDSCGKRFSQLGNMNKHHVRIHTKEKPFQCKYCGKSFADRSCKDRHERAVHTKEKPYTCRFCNKSFSATASRIAHERIHTKEKPYTCRFCSKGFNQAGAKTRHERVHTKERPYQCRYCDKTFSQTGDRKRHEDIHLRDARPDTGHSQESITMITVPHAQVPEARITE